MDFLADEMDGLLIRGDGDFYAGSWRDVFVTLISTAAIVEFSAALASLVALKATAIAPAFATGILIAATAIISTAIVTITGRTFPFRFEIGGFRFVALLARISRPRGTEGELGQQTLQGIGIGIGHRMKFNGSFLE